MQLNKPELVSYLLIAFVSGVGAFYGFSPWLLIAVACGLLFTIRAVIRRWAPMWEVNAPPRGPRRRASPARLWLLFTISVLFCFAAVLTWRRDPLTSLATLTFFGAGALLFATVIFRQGRERRFDATLVRVVGGVEIHIALTRVWILATGLMLVGGTICLAVKSNPWILTLVGVLILFSGVALAVAASTGYLSRQFIKFTPDGILFGERNYQFRVPWDEVREIRPFEYANNPFVGLVLGNPHAIEVTPPQRLGQLWKQIGRNRGVMGVDVVIAPLNFGLEVPPLVAALGRYVAEPVSRQELAQGTQTANLLSGPDCS
jgi:hypothetical protein